METNVEFLKNKIANQNHVLLYGELMKIIEKEMVNFELVKFNMNDALATAHSGGVYINKDAIGRYGFPKTMHFILHEIDHLKQFKNKKVFKYHDTDTEFELPILDRVEYVLAAEYDAEDFAIKTEKKIYKKFKLEYKEIETIFGEPLELEYQIQMYVAGSKMLYDNYS